MPTPPENRDPAEPSPWGEWLARRDEQAEQPEQPASAPVYDPEQYRRPAAQPEPEQPSFPGQPDPYQPQYYNQHAQQHPEHYADQYPDQYPAQQYPDPGYQDPPGYPQYQGQPQYQPYAEQPYQGQQYPPQPYQGQPQYQGQPYPPEQYAGQYGGPPGDPYDPYSPPGGRRRPSLVLLGGIAAAVLALVIGGAFVLQSLRGSDSTTVDAGGGSAGPAPGSSASPSATTQSPSPSESESAPAEVTGATDVPADEAEQQLGDAGVDGTGDIRLAESWTDANGGNLLVASRVVDKKDGDRVIAATIKVWHVTHTDTDPKVVRTMTDPVSACELDFDTDVDTAQGFVKDLDGDGIAEATVAWHISCRGDVGPALAKVALLSDGNKYILRGDGYPDGRPNDPNVPKTAVKEVDPKASQWPDGFKDAATEVFLTLYS